MRTAVVLGILLLVVFTARADDKVEDAPALERCEAGAIDDCCWLGRRWALDDAPALQRDGERTTSSTFASSRYCAIAQKSSACIDRLLDGSAGRARYSKRSRPRRALRRSTARASGVLVETR